jgi:hypothetical protein
MKCTSCGLKLDLRKKKSFVYASFNLQSKSFFDNLLKKDYWVFCSSKCKSKADMDWASGNFEKLHGSKKLNFRP